MRNLIERLRGGPTSIRTRVVIVAVTLLAATVVAVVLVTRAVLEIRLDQRIDEELRQEARELRRLAEGRDPRDGRPFGNDVERVFEVFLERNVPLANESVLTFVDGRLFLRTRAAAAYRLESDETLVRQWANLTQPKRADVATPAGDVEYVAVPLRVGDTTAGVFVAAIFADRSKRDFDEAIAAATAVGAAALLLGSLAAWWLAGRVAEPLRRLTHTARAISDRDFSERIDIRGRDEVGQLAETFNEMLDRLAHAFAAQRAFLDDAGHELRTPVTIIRGHLEVLEHDPDGRAEAIALVFDELDRMARIIDDLLVLAKREQPDFLQLSTVDVGELTSELLAKARALSGERVWIADGVGKGVIVADRQRLTQAMLQLADNAVRHGGGDVVAIGSAVTDGHARFWVRDRGAGIDPRAHAYVFDRFARASPPSDDRAGAGLGLAIVRAIAEAHHGSVDVSSAVGEGSTFTVSVPVDQPVADEHVG